MELDPKWEMWENSSRGNSKCKGTEAKKNDKHQRHVSKKPSWHGAERVRDEAQLVQAGDSA